MNDLVSIITPAHNSARYIGECIQSVLAQSYTAWEMLIIDDGSTDGTRDIVKRYADKRIKYYRNEQQQGAALSRNAMLREAQGRWIAFLDSDDKWESHKLEHQIDFMERGGYAFSYTCYREIDESSAELGNMVGGPKRISRQGMMRFCWPGCLTVMYDATKVGLIQIADIAKNNDYAMWLQAIKKADCHLLPESTAYYRRHSGSISSHSYLTMTMWHYRLFRDAMQMSAPYSVFCTLRNLIFGMLKKIVYVKHYTVR